MAYIGRTYTDRRDIWRQIENAVATADWLLKWADCDGPLAHLPTNDRAVRLIMNARRHLLTEASQLRASVR
jgi:hypothetical protein